MDFKTKWHARQIGLDLVSHVLCFTTFGVFLPIYVLGSRFMELGLSMYPGYHWPKTAPITYMLQQFWDFSAWPFVQWLPLTLVADALLRRFAYRLHR